MLRRSLGCRTFRGTLGGRIADRLAGRMADRLAGMLRGTLGRTLRCAFGCTLGHGTLGSALDGFGTCHRLDMIGPRLSFRTLRTLHGFSTFGRPRLDGLAHLRRGCGSLFRRLLRSCLDAFGHALDRADLRRGLFGVRSWARSRARSRARSWARSWG